MSAGTFFYKLEYFWLLLKKKVNVKMYVISINYYGLLRNYVKLRNYGIT